MRAARPPRYLRRARGSSRKGAPTVCAELLPSVPTGGARGPDDSQHDPISGLSLRCGPLTSGRQLTVGPALGVCRLPQTGGVRPMIALTGQAVGAGVVSRGRPGCFSVDGSPVGLEKVFDLVHGCLLFGHE